MQIKQILVKNMTTSCLVSDNFDSKKSILFLHGRGQSKKSFEKIYKILDEKKISYLSFDFPGFGSTQIPNNDWGIDEYADFTKEFIEKMELENPVLVGHSFGGRVCIILGGVYDNLKKIVLIGAAGIKPKTKKMNYIITKTGKAFFSIPGLKGIGNKIRKKVSSQDYNDSGVLKEIFLKVVNKDLTDLLLYVRFPTLLIRGLKDLATPIADGLKMDKMIKDSKIKIFENGTHFVYDEYPNEVWEEIEKFI